MAKDIKVTFKKDEEDIYEYILLKGKGIFIKELIRKEMNSTINSLDKFSGSFDDMDSSIKKMLVQILQNTNDIKNIVSDNKNFAVNTYSNLNDTVKADITNDNKYEIISDFSIDDLLELNLKIYTDLMALIILNSGILMIL